MSNSLRGTFPLLLLLLIATGCATNEPTIQAEAQQRWDEYRAAVKFELANEKLRGGDVERAISLAREAGALSPDRPAHAELLAKGYMARGDFSSARRVLDAARRAFAGSGNLHYLMGVVHQRDRDWPRAGAAFAEAVSADPTQLDYHIALAQAIARSDSAKAIVQLGSQTERFDFEALFHLALAELKRGAGDIAGACHEYDRAMELGADDHDTRESAATFHYQLGHFGRARDLLEPLVSAIPGAASPLLLPYARCLMETGALDLALTLLERSVDRRRDHTAAWLLLAEARAAAGDLTQAVTAANRAATLKPDSADAQLLLTALRLAAGDPAGAIASAASSLEANPKSTEAYLLLGRVFEQMHDGPLAIEMYRQAVGIDPQCKIASELLARLTE
ncbi:MAG: tetratricopeptide repeat protein [Planctomycetes bacterium]|nr:tetratricopeptide repeat protein [Planctomycetota bacterium]